MHTSADAICHEGGRCFVIVHAQGCVDAVSEAHGFDFFFLVHSASRQIFWHVIYVWKFSSGLSNATNSGFKNKYIGIKLLLFVLYFRTVYGYYLCIIPFFF